MTHPRSHSSLVTQPVAEVGMGAACSGPCLHSLPWSGHLGEGGARSSHHSTGQAARNAERQGNSLPAGPSCRHSSPPSWLTCEHTLRQQPRPPTRAFSRECVHRVALLGTAAMREQAGSTPQGWARLDPRRSSPDLPPVVLCKVPFKTLFSGLQVRTWWDTKDIFSKVSISLCEKAFQSCENYIT